VVVCNVEVLVVVRDTPLYVVRKLVLEDDEVVGNVEVLVVVLDTPTVDVDRKLVLVLDTCDNFVVVVVELSSRLAKSRMDARMNDPDAVRWLFGQLPAASDPGRRAAHFSSLSLMAQLASEMLCCFRKSSQT